MVHIFFLFLVSTRPSRCNTFATRQILTNYFDPTKWRGWKNKLRSGKSTICSGSIYSIQPDKYRNLSFYRSAEPFVCDANMSEYTQTEFEFWHFNFELRLKWDFRDNRYVINWTRKTPTNWNLNRYTGQNR